MPLKTITIEDKTYAELTADGKPIYVGEDGTETGYDAEELASNLTAARGEAASRRTELKEVKDQLATFEGIENPEAALDALKTVKNLEDKQLVDAGEVEKVKTEAVKAVEEKYEAQIEQTYKPVIAERDSLQAALQKEMLGGRFVRSKFIEEKMVMPATFVQAAFGPHFSIDDDKVVAKYSDGTEVFSKANPGKLAEFEEALELLVNASPDKDRILKGANKSGTGAPGSGGGDGGSDGMSVEAFEKMPLHERNKYIREGGKLIDEAA